MRPENLTEMQTAIRHLITAVANANLYSVEHQQIKRLCEASQGCFENLLREQGKLSLLMVEGVLLFDNIPLPPGLHAQKLAQLMERHRINRLILAPGLEPEELEKLVEFWTQPGKSRQGLPECPHLRFETLAESEALPSQATLDESSIYDAAGLGEVKKKGQNRLAEMFEDFGRKKTMHVAGLNEIVSSFIEAFSREVLSLLVLLPIRTMDEYTFTHGLNVCLLNLAQAMNLGIEGQLLHDIGLAALVHDLGKLHIPLEILAKPGKLDEREWGIMHQHPAQGAELLLDTPGMPQLAVITAFEHHLRYDLKGYPAVSAHWNQHLCSQMTTISDIYDALRTTRPYKAAKTAETCAEILREAAGSEIHPQLAGNFLSLLDHSAQKSGLHCF
jgi:HD-GYP domain-containing protein (c-di-GMP phosphodiesterase class II)